MSHVNRIPVMQNNDDPLAGYHALVEEYHALVAFGEPGSVADYVAALVARLAALEREVTRLREYAWHKPECPQFRPRVKLDLGPGWVSGGGYMKPCTCGLSD